MPRMRHPQMLLWLPMALLLALQIWFSASSEHLRPAIEQMPPPPTETSLKALAFGDREFLYRYLGRWLQGVGDGGGRLLPLRDMNYDYVTGWLGALDALDDNRSEFVRSVGAYYFALVAISPDRIGKVYDYILANALRDPQREWRWLLWNARIARFPLNDRARVVDLARRIAAMPRRDGVPAWIKLVAVRLYQFAGDEAAARSVVEHLSPQELAEIQAARGRDAEQALSEHPQSTKPRPGPGSGSDPDRK